MKKIVLVLAVLVILFQIEFSQKTDVTKSKMVSIPRELASILILNQPDCLIKFEKLDLLSDEKATHRVLKYEIRNLSSKNIKSISIEEFYISKTGYWSRLGRRNENTFSTKNVGLTPGKTFENYSNEEFELVEMTKEVEKVFQSKTDNKKSMKLSVMVMVKKIIFEDNSELNYESLSDSINEFINPD